MTLWAQPRLIPLLQTLKGGAGRILPLHEKEPDVEDDVDLELFEVMHALRLTPEDVSADVPYLLAEEPGEAADFPDILSEARAMRQLDLLVSVDTCSAHLAGALGVPVWTSLPREADWRWMRDRSDTPWYPTMTLFRQRRAGDWIEVIGRVMAELDRKSVSCRHSGGC